MNDAATVVTTGHPLQDVDRVLLRELLDVLGAIGTNWINRIGDRVIARHGYLTVMMTSELGDLRARYMAEAGLELFLLLRDEPSPSAADPRVLGIGRQRAEAHFGPLLESLGGRAA